jgi:hypothetical protein
MSEADWLRIRDQWRELLSNVLDLLQLKQVAADLRVTVSALSHAASWNGKNAFHADWIPYLIVKAPSAQVVSFLAGLRGLAVVEPPKMSPEEELRALKASLHRHLGEDLRTVIVNSAKVGR